MVIFHSYVKLPEGTPLTPPSQRLRGRVWHLRLCLCSLRCFGALGRGLVRRQLDVGQHQLPAVEVASQEAHGIAQGMGLHHSFGLDERWWEGDWMIWIFDVLGCESWFGVTCAVVAFYHLLASQRLYIKSTYFDSSHACSIAHRPAPSTCPRCSAKLWERTSRLL